MSQTEVPDTRHKIVIVGGGAGGLELATRLGRKLGKKGVAEVTLVDASWTHIWKPLLHEVAAGTLDVAEHQVEYLAQARRNHFRFRLGRMEGLDRSNRLVYVAPNHNDEGVEITLRRSFPYDTLVIAVGSTSNDFGITGVKDHCLFLDTTEQAKRFQQRLIRCTLRAHAQEAPIAEGQMDVAIVGAGATGVELAAQLHRATRQLSAYGLDRVDPEKDVHLNLVEAGPRILPALPERLSFAVEQQLSKIGVSVFTNEKVVEVTAEGVRTGSGQLIAAAFKVWAAGVKAPDFLREIDGLETTNTNQLLVRPDLQTTRDENVFALGDCAACPLPDGSGYVPPRAQAAHQQATFLARMLVRRLQGKPLKDYRYKDYGSLVTLGQYSTVGSLMGNLTGSVMISGFIARMLYLSLHQMHQLVLHGWPRTMLMTAANFLRRGIDPQIKLH
jgi:NADH dehydrogenase